MLEYFTGTKLARLRYDELVTPTPRMDSAAAVRAYASRAGLRFRHLAKAQRLRRN